MKSFKQFNEENSKSVVFTFGRFNPPTTGHEKLLIKVASLAIGNDYKIFASQSNNPKKDPLEYKEKVMLMRKIFPKHGRNIIYDKKIKNAIDALVYLYNAGYTKATMVVGADRISDFKSLLNKYNGVKARHGFYDFPEGISIVSAGDRDPDADDVSGMSASKMRAAAIEGDFQSFSNGLPKSFGDKLGVFNLLRKRMGLKEMTNFRKHIELKRSDIRERYIAEEVFLVGDRFLNLKGEIHVVEERYTNYILGSDDKKYFLNKIVEVKQDDDIDDRKGSQPAKYYSDDMAKSTKSKRAAQFKKQAEMDDDDPKAYEPAPGDASAKTKKSKHTKRFKDMFGESTEEGIRDKAEKTGISYGILKKVFDRGVAAWKSGHRPGTTATQWGYARINSFATGGKTQTTTDADLWKKHKGIKESNEVDERTEYMSMSQLQKMLKKEYGLRAKDLKIVKIKGGLSIQTPSGQELERYNHVPKLGYTISEENKEDGEVEEGVNDPAIFKAVFLAGGPGSGKSFTVGKTGLTALGFKIVNSDDKFEAALKKADLEPTPDNIFSPKGQKLRGRAKELTAKQRDIYIDGRLGLVIDGTGKNFAKIKKQSELLKAIGYDVAMIFVNTDLDTALIRNRKRSRSLPDAEVETMWKEVQNNLGKFQSTFGSNFIIVDNSEGANIEKATTSAYKKMAKFAKDSPKNNIAKKWISKQLGEATWRSEGHYTADGKEWTGDQHQTDGQIMTGKVHTDDSVNLYHFKELSPEVRKKVLATFKQYK